MADSKDTRSTIASHEPGSLRDGTAGLEVGPNGPTREDAIKDGQESAKENIKQEKRESSIADTNTVEEVMDDARESAKLNHEVEQSLQNVDAKGDLTNDTSDKAKVATAKAQLDPNGDDPISEKEVRDSALDASMETGNKTAVTNKEAANRARNPGKAEEEAPRSIAGDGAKPAQNATTERVSQDSTSNREEAKRGEVKRTERKS